MAHEKMFRVIVLGGVALVGPTSCAISLAPVDSDAAADHAFPGELPAQVDASDVLPHTMPVVDSGFPHTSPVRPDAGTDAMSFPVTAPAQPDADTDAGCVMPIETAFIPDC